SSNVDGNSPLGETRLVAPSVRQVHPVCDEKAQLLAYDKCDGGVGGGGGKRSSLGEVNGSPPPYPKRASLESNPSPTYPLTPNICVEGGRIEFIKPPPEGDTAATTPTETPPTPPATPRVVRVTVTRALQTDDADNKCEDRKEKLEARVAELEAALDDAQKTEQRDKQTIAKLQKQIAK
ncbi:PREDICTED: uncharacterized protein LOC108557554, partial [Nicrophorus vespilloides]|uniref:Uncharacterized protein LOC108557554 n=1 Tax=Nicrophorus vespilloides TaxID=110193 RepID=A0ABM1M4V3_NICVS